MSIGIPAQALFEQWAGMPYNSLDGWEFHPYQSDSIIKAIAAVQGTEIHFAIAPGWLNRVIRRSNTREFLAPLIDRRGYLTTRAVAGEHGEFLARLGFVLTRTDGAVDYYMLTDLPFAGRPNKQTLN